MAAIANQRCPSTKSRRQRKSMPDQIINPKVFTDAAIDAKKTRTRFLTDPFSGFRWQRPMWCGWIEDGKSLVAGKLNWAFFVVVVWNKFRIFFFQARRLYFSHFFTIFDYEEDNLAYILLSTGRFNLSFPSIFTLEDVGSGN